MYHINKTIGLQDPPDAPPAGRVRKVGRLFSGFCSRIPFLTFVATALMVAGCTTAKVPKGNVPLAPQYRFEDVPVHPKLTIDASESFIFETQSLKAGILVYHGNESVNEVAEFFKTEMPQHAWRLVNAIEAKGTVLMSFEKEGWSALMRVNRETLETTVEITIGPRDDGSSGLAPPKRK